MKILIVDDEQLARERLQRHLLELDSKTELFQAENGLSALAQTEKYNPDIILLDIRMPGMDGIETANKLSQLETPPAIIFITAYDEYALEAFDSQAIAYLLKPVRKEKLEKALHSANRLNRAQLQNLHLANNDPRKQYLSVHIHSGIRQIDLEEIYFFLAEQKYVTVKYRDGDLLAEVLIDESLKSIEERFEKQFIRIHRNALVSKQKIKAIRKDQQGRFLVELKGIDEKIEVSRRHVTDIRKFLE
jgi:two-component system response regulator AlgR